MPLNLGTAVGYLDLDTSGFSRGFQTALSSLKTFQSQSAGVTDKLTAAGTALTSAGSTLTKSVTVPLVGLGTAAVATTTKFEAAMSQVQATMGISKDAMAELDGATVNAMDALSDLAVELGATTKFSAVEAAEAINYMALAGYDVEKTYGMLPTVLNLAAAGNFDLARASDMVTDAQTALGLSIEETSIMVDEWAKAASRSNTSVEQLGDAILTIGGTAQYMAGGTDRLATVLGVLADNGIKGSEAGTHLRNMILKLAAPTTEGAVALDELGVSIFDASGNMRDFQDIFMDFNEAMKDMTEEQKITYFSDLFNVRDVAAANALLNTSVERWEELGGAISDADGAAKQMSETQLDNLNGQLTILKSSLEGMAIAFGELLLPLVKDITSGIQSLVSWINGLDEKQKATIVRILEIVALVGPALLILGKIVGAISSIISIIGTLKTAISAVAVGPVALIIAAIAAVVGAFIYLWNNCEEFRNFWINLWESIKEIANTVVNAIVTFFTETIPNAIDAVLEWIRGFVDDVRTFFTETIPAALQVLVDWFTELPEKIGYAIGFAVGTLARWAVNLYDTVVEEVPKIIQAIVDFFAELPGKVWDWLVQTIEKVKTWVSDTVQTVKQQVPQIINSILSFFAELPGKVWDWLVNVVENIKTWISDMTQKVKDLFPEVIQAILDFFADLPGQMLSIGSDLMTGLWNGIQSVGSWVSNKVSDIGNGIVSGFKDAFGIHSPSTVMAEQGQYLMKGLVLGIDEGEAGVLAAIMGLFNDLMARFDTLIAKLEGLFSFDFLAFSDDEAQAKLVQYNSTLLNTLAIYQQLEQSLRACLDYAQQLFQDKYAQLASFASNVSEASALSLPEFAGQGTGVNKTETTILAYLSQLLQIIRADRTVKTKQPITIIVQASGKEMSRTVIEDINELTRMTGEDVLL